MMAANEKLSGQFAQMSQEEYEASAGEGRRWVYHATDQPEGIAEGVNMENVPRNLGRMRFEAGEYAEYSPGAGIGRGTYVGATPAAVSGYGRHMFGFSVPTEHLEVPPESGGSEAPESIERHLNWSNGALLTHNLGSQFIVNMGQSRWATLGGLEHHQISAMRRGESVPEEHQSERVKDIVRRTKERGEEL